MKWLNDFSTGKSQLVLFGRSHNTGAVDVKINGYVSDEKSYFDKMLVLSFSSKLDCGSYIISIAKTATKKIGALICSMKFLSPEVALYLCKSTIQPCMEYCCHVWAGVPCCHLEILDYKNEYVGLMVFHLLPPLNPSLIIKMYPAQVFSIGITLVVVHVNWLHFFYFLIL